MRKNKFRDILIIYFVTLGFITASVSAEVINLPLTEGVYHMITSPVLPQDPDPQVSLTDDLGAYDKTQWRLFRYNTVNSRYDELKSEYWDPIEDDFQFGRGYWIISLNSTEIDIEGEPVVGDQIILKWAENGGWNQIGNIFDYDFPIASLYVVRETDPDPLQNRVQLIDAANNDLTYVTLQGFENGSYIDIPGNGKNSLEDRKGYWLKVNEGVGEDVVLWFVVGGPSALSKELYLSEEFFERVVQQEDPPNPPPGIDGSSSTSFSGGSGGGGCFIATVTYGDYNHPRVQILRKFRDRYLSTNAFGRVFVSLYYRHSPTLARFVAKRSSMQALVRFNLLPVIGISAIVFKMNIYVLLIVLIFPSFLGYFLFKKGVWGKCNLKCSGREKKVKRKK